MTTPIDGPVIHLQSAFAASGSEDEQGVIVGRCPACQTGVTTFAETADATFIACSRGCTPEQVLDALRVRGDCHRA